MDIKKDSSILEPAPYTTQGRYIQRDFNGPFDPLSPLTAYGLITEFFSVGISERLGFGTTRYPDSNFEGDFRNALEEISSTKFRDVFCLMVLIHRSFQELIFYYDALNIAIRKEKDGPRYNIPSEVNYHQNTTPLNIVGPTDAGEFELINSFNGALKNIDNLSKKLRDTIVRLTGFEFIPVDYDGNEQLFKSQENRATIQLIPDAVNGTLKPVIYIQKGYEYNIGEIMHEFLAWHYITISGIPSSDRELSKRKDELPSKFHILEALFENPEILFALDKNLYSNAA